MKYLKSFLQLNESSSDIDYIGLILSNLSDTSPKLLSKHCDDNILLYDLNIKNSNWDSDELDTANDRLLDEGWKVLNIERFDDMVYLSVISKDFLSRLKSRGVKLWSDLEWKDWNLNKSTGSQCLHSKFNFGGLNISIINGNNGGSNNLINWIEVYASSDGSSAFADFNEGTFEDGEIRYYNSVEAEIGLIEIQL